MKVMAIVGSPRKGGNTDILIDKVLEGAKSTGNVEVEKIYVYDSDIHYCTGCGLHNILFGSKDCPFKDDMPGIMERMIEADAFIFGTPNHCRTISAGLTNFFSRMMPLLKMDVEKDDKGNIIHAEANPLIKNKKAVNVITQGDFSPSSSSLVFMVLDSNLRDFQLQKVGEVISTGNLHHIKVKDKKEDLQAAYDTGVRLGMSGK